MIILGIETSCDETSAALVKNGSYVLSNIVASSLKLHRKYGGVIPEIASRAQLEYIQPVVSTALKEAKIKIKDIDLIAVTKGPGLGGSLLIGLSFAKALSFAIKKPFIGIDHIQAHLYAPALSQKIKPPFVGLVVSGGHTSLFFVKNFLSFKLLGHTVDDAIGEAFDKVAKIMGLAYPGGPLVEKLARRCKNSKIRFTCGRLDRKLDFSFSGIKTAVLYRVNSLNGKISFRDKTGIAHAFQEAVFDDVVKKSLLACESKKTKRLVIGGGVASNMRFRQKLMQAALKNRIKIYFPEHNYCLDNAAMIAGLAYHLYKKMGGSKLSMQIEPT